METFCLLKSCLVMVPVLIIIWCIAIVNAISKGKLDQYGIRPRETAGLGGVILAPFIHASLGHVAGNSLPLYGLGSIVLVRGWRVFNSVSLTVWLLGGMLTWIFARGKSSHVGASGVVYGYFAYLLSAAALERNWTSVILAVVASVCYGGIMAGVESLAPFGSSKVSWEGHLCGFLAGCFIAWLLNFLDRRAAHAASIGGKRQQADVERQGLLSEEETQ